MPAGGAHLAQIVAPPSLARLAVESLTEIILSGDILPGDDIEH